MKADRFTYKYSLTFTLPCESLYNQIVSFNNITESLISALPTWHIDRLVRNAFFMHKLLNKIIYQH